MKTLFFTLALIGTVIGAETPKEKEKAKEELVFPIAEMKLTNGRVWKNVTVVRYEKTNVLLKSSAGIGPLLYSYVPEPTRGLMIAARDESLKVAEQTRAATAMAENKQRADIFQKNEAERAAKEAWHRRVRSAIHAGELLAGMTEEEVKQVIGAPQRINSGGGFDQWIYSNSYVYIRDGKFVSRTNRN